MTSRGAVSPESWWESGIVQILLNQWSPPSHGRPQLVSLWALSHMGPERDLVSLWWGRPWLGLLSLGLVSLWLDRTRFAFRTGCGGARLESHTIYQLNGFRKSTPPQNRQLVLLISSSKQ